MAARAQNTGGVADWRREAGNAAAAEARWFRVGGKVLPQQQNPTQAPGHSDHADAERGSLNIPNDAVFGSIRRVFCLVQLHRCAVAAAPCIINDRVLLQTGNQI